MTPSLFGELTMLTRPRYTIVSIVCIKSDQMMVARHITTYRASILCVTSDEMARLAALLHHDMRNQKAHSGPINTHDATEFKQKDLGAYNKSGYFDIVATPQKDDVMIWGGRVLRWLVCHS